MSHGVPLSRDAAHVHGAPPGGRDADPRDPRSHSSDSGLGPVGTVPEKPRRADPRDGHGRGTRLHVHRIRQGSAHEAQSRHPPPARAAARQRAAGRRAPARDHVLAPRRAGPLLRRRDRDGRQHLPRRPRRRAHADAVDVGPQRRLLARRLGAALPAATDGPGLRLPGRQHRGAAADAVVAPPLAPALHRPAQGAPRLRPRHLRAAEAGEPAHLRSRPEVRGGRRALRPQRCALGPGRRARPFGVRRLGPGGDVRAHALPAGGRPSLPAHPRTERILLVSTETQLIDFVTSRRWFASKTREVVHARVLDRVSLHEGEPELNVELVEICFDTGTHETYQLLTSGKELDALADPRHTRELVHMMRAGAMTRGGEGILEFRAVEGFASLGTELTTARLITSEQSNTSIVFDDELILKVFRRMEPGVNPELEMLRFLTERNFENIAQLGGWYAYVGQPLDATLGVLQQFVRGAVDGWEMALDELETEPERFVTRLRRLGEGSGPVHRGAGVFVTRLRRLGQVSGSMHAVLGSDASDPTFCSEDPSGESLALLTATVDEEISRIFVELPEEIEALDPIRGRGEEVRESLALLSHAGSFGKQIRTHGDLHLGQTLWAPERDDWALIDFEGEPARSLAERRRKRSPLRDVAGMLRSFAYAVSAVEILRGSVAPEGWEQRAREEFLKGYNETVDQSLMPAGDPAFQRLLTVFELEKAVYELRYELNNRPEWIHIPVAGILRMLETAT